MTETDVPNVPRDAPARTGDVRARRSVLGLAILCLVLSPPVQTSDATVRDLFARVTDSVVVVRTLERMVFNGEAPTERPISDLGSGVLISNEGLVLTAAHLVQAADIVRVKFSDGTQATAEVVASEPAADIALLQLTEIPPSAVAAPLGDSDAAAIGEQVIVIGTPYGLGHALSVGYISARHLAPTPGGPVHLGEFFQTDASINRGNSGGPMFNQKGEVIGIVSYILSRSGAFEGIGFAVTSNTVRSLLFERTVFWSGITAFALSPLQARALNLPRDHGVLVQRVARGSIGDEIGLRPGFLPATIGDTQLVLGGDVILSVDDIPVGAGEDSERLRDHLSRVTAGQQVRLEIFRRGQIVEQRWAASGSRLYDGSRAVDAPGAGSEQTTN